MPTLLLFLSLFISLTSFSQSPLNTTAHAHSHNDYKQKNPLYEAWSNEFGSIEADIFLFDGMLVVAHDSSEMLQRRTLDSLYLEPLQKLINQNGGSVYTNNSRELQLMIDIKSEALPTLRKLIAVIEAHDGLNNNASLKIVISGNRPPASEFSQYPSWILFDGEPDKKYTPSALEKIPMFSDDFARYSHWKGVGEMPADDKRVIKQMIDKVHGLKKKVRFWNAPDIPSAWKLFVELGVDYINTDKIDELGRFLGN